MIHEVCGVDGGKRLVATHPHPEESPTEFSWRTDSEGNVRSFSIASGPNEETLVVATRMRDTAFKHVLRTMHLKDAASPIYCVAGPPAIVKASHEMLNKAGMNDDDIRAEEFAGY